MAKKKDLMNKIERLEASGKIEEAEKIEKIMDERKSKKSGGMLGGLFWKSEKAKEAEAGSAELDAPEMEDDLPVDTHEDTDAALSEDELLALLGGSKSEDEAEAQEAEAAESPEPASEPEKSEPEKSESESSEPTPEPEPETAEELWEMAKKIRAEIDRGTKSFETKLKKANDQLAEIEAKAEAIEKAETEAKAKAEAEEKARKEAEEKAKAEAEAREKAEAEAKAKTKADLLASINKADKPRVGKAYKWWDYDTATWNITADVWSANQLSDKWEVVYVWYRNGDIERLLNKEEMEKHCPK